MADIAAIFHWSRSELWATPTPELLDWRERAVERFRAMYAAKSQH
ncbi:GpE family phage tail protein [Serratia marcescens]|nr:GpE family phage tail protein [Serratia marcescens]MDK1707002.1 GpE family phage tail protein [Serratia marcescens]